MSYTYNKPDAGDTISASQSVLKDNFTAIKTLVDVNHVTFDLADQGKHTYVTMPQQTSFPTIGATEWSMFSASDGTNTQLYLRNNSSAGTIAADTPITKATKASPGECYLPCGIRMKWGTGSISGGSSTASAVWGVGTDFSNLYNITFSISTTYTSAYDNRDYHLAMTGTVSGWNVARSSTYNGAPVSFYYLAIGD